MQGRQGSCVERRNCQAGRLDTFIERYQLTSMAGLAEVPLIQSAVSVVQSSDRFAAYTDQRAPRCHTLRYGRPRMSLDAAT
ncbi:MAG: hypothetical protein JNJ60_09080 [Rhodocyclaceae bacterium]|nr:hypothetical protein [Rhodocyclaceae bacterium]